MADYPADQTYPGRDPLHNAPYSFPMLSAKYVGIGAGGASRFNGCYTETDETLPAPNFHAVNSHQQPGNPFRPRIHRTSTARAGVGRFRPKQLDGWALTVRSTGGTTPPRPTSMKLIQESADKPPNDEYRGTKREMRFPIDGPHPVSPRDGVMETGDPLIPISNSLETRHEQFQKCKPLYRWTVQLLKTYKPLSTNKKICPQRPVIFLWQRSRGNRWSDRGHGDSPRQSASVTFIPKANISPEQEIFIGVVRPEH